MKSHKNIFESLYNRLTADSALIFFVIITQAIISAVWPESGVAFHFGKMLFVVAFIKAVYLGVLSSLITFGVKWLKWLVIFINITILELYSYLAIQFDVRFTTNVFALVLQTNSKEASEFFHQFFPAHTIFLLIIILVVSVVAYYILNLLGSYISKKIGKVKKITKTVFSIISLLLSLTSLAINVITDYRYINNGSPKIIHSLFYDTTLPHQDLLMAYCSVSGNEDKVKRIQEANDKIAIDSCDFSCNNIVLVIGESYIKGHASLYGYGHTTTPFMEKEQRNGNLFAFSDVLAHASSTNVCMQYFYSIKSIDDKLIWEDAPLLPAIFKKAGYYVSLLDNQNTRYSGTSTLDYSTSFFINPMEIHKQCFDYRNDKLFRYDLDMINAEKQVLTSTKSSHTFTIIHLFGQHFGASERYPHISEHTIFKCDSIRRKDIKDKDMVQEIVYYDNATRYNDLVLNEIINIYRDKEAVILYVSDHGECVYDTSQLSYGRPLSDRKSLETIKVLYEIPMVMWCSNNYIIKHTDVVERIKASVDRPFMNDDVCHILFDIAGIRGNFYDASRSVINKNYMPRSRVVNNGQLNYDAYKNEIQKVRLRTQDN